MAFSQWSQETDLIVQLNHTTGRPGLPAFLSENFQNKCSDSNEFLDDALRITNRAAIQKQSGPPSRGLILLEGRPDTTCFATSTFLWLILVACSPVRKGTPSIWGGFALSQQPQTGLHAPFRVQRILWQAYYMCPEGRVKITKPKA